MSIQLNPVSIENVSDSFYPLSNTVATSLVEHLPLGTSAICIQLSGCDARKILYTLFSEQDNGTHLHFLTDLGFPRNYDVTCVEEEPAVLGHFSDGNSDGSSQHFPLYDTVGRPQ